MLLVLVCISLVEIVAGLTNQINTDCDRHPIGLQNRSIVPNSSFTASSYYDARYKPSGGRLNSTHGWAPRTKNDTQDYLQIDLGKKSLVCAVATQGNGYVYASEWVTHYKLNYSMDGVVWNTYQDNEEDKIFQGNTDQFTVVKQYLQNSQPTRYIRFIPTSFKTHKTIRVEVYASDLGQVELHVTPHQRLLQLTWGIMKGQVRSYMIEFDNKSMIESFTLPNTTQGYNLTNLRPYTEYSVRIKAIPTNNGVGLWSNWIYVKTSISEPKARPFNVSLTPMSTKEIKVTWKLGGIELLNGPLAGYRIAYTEKRATEVIDVGNTTSYTLTSLEATTEYNITVAVNNTKYIGPSSDVVRATTYGKAPTCSPKIISAEAVSSTSIHVTWKPPLEGKCRNGVLQGYTISWDLTDGVRLKRERTNDPKITNWTLTGLEKYSQYRISVRAYTIIDGPPDTIGAKTAEDGPSCYSHIKSVLPVNSTSIRVDWYPLPNQPCLNGILRGYKIAYRRFDNLSLHFVNISNPNTTTKVLTGLRKYTEYHIHVLGYTVKNGVLSNASVGRTLEDVPDCSPVITNIQAASSTSIRVAWQQDPTCLNGKLRGYIIEYSLLGNSTVQSINITDDRLSSNKTVTGLGKYTSYRFRIVAYTIGEGPMNNVSVIRTGEDAPTCSPKLLSAQTLSSSSVRLTWTPPDNTECRNGILRGYRIKCKLLEGSKIENFTVSDPNATTHVVGGLHHYTWYTFWVLAYTVANGPWSNMVSNRTGEDAPKCSPTLVSVRNVSSTCISVTWTPLATRECRNGIIRGYKIYYTNNRTLERLVIKIIDNNTTAVNVTGLSKYTEYSFRILAYTVEDGPPGNEITQRTSEDAPDCSPEIKSVKALSSTSVQVKWKRLPYLSCTNGIVRGYKVNYKRREGESTIQISNRDATTTNITGLKKFTSYKFQVLAYTVKDGPLSNETLAKTKEDAPSAPVNVNRTLLHANGSVGPRVEVRWDEPHAKNGVIQKYTLVYLYNHDKYTEKKVVIPLKGQRTHVHTINVVGETTFSFKIKAHTIKDGPYQHGEDLIIPPYPPSTAPTNISTRKINDTSFLMQWSPIPRHKSNGNITKYEVSWTLSSRIRTLRVKRYLDEKIKSDSTEELQYMINGLLSCAQYSICVRAYTRVGPGPYSTPIKINTSKPASPYDVLAKTTNATSVLLLWRKPANVIERINKYTIEYKGHKTYTERYKTTGNATVQDGRTALWITNLLPATHYEFWVSASTVCGRSPKSDSTKTKTSITNPLAPNITTVQQYHDTGVEVNVTLFPSLQINGPISAYQVIVQFQRTSNSLVRMPSNYRNSLYNYPVAAAKNLDYYVTAELPSDWLSSSKELVIGDNTTHKNYRNVPLEKGSRYHIYQRAVTDDKGRLMYSKEVLVANVTVAAEVKEETKARIQDSPGSETLVGGIIGLMLLLILVVVVGYIIWRRHRNAQKKDIQMISVPVKVLTPPEQPRSTNYQDQKKEEVVKPIHVTKFAEYIATVRKDDFSQLINQYKSIPSIHNFSCIAAKKPVNKFKNRYGNIVPYDHSRVTLQHIEEPEESDYVNACFVHGYDGSQKTYIASQGPLPETVNDFWRMIWEQNTSSIVMLTNLIELGKRKCHQYWPEDSEQYADIKIKNHKTEVYADYIIRTFLLSKGTNEKISRRVRLFHFIAWPDKGVPKNATALLSFRRKVRELTKWNTGPTVIHCSAGVGRTGTYMVIDAMLEQVENKETIDVFNYLKVLRKDRSYMVQTSEQYVFIHMAIFEEITCGNSEIQANDLEIAMQNLAAIDDEQNLTGYAMEFLRLEFVASYGMSEECDVGQDEENQQKNRYQNIVAMDRFRVVLSTDDSNQGDYINASFIDTYRERNAFVMTQAPMENTIVDFWRMIMDYEIGTIVMLNNLQEGDETFPEYWPEEGIVLYNGIEVKLLKTEQYADIISRQIQISYQSVNHNVQHLQYTAWENHSVPNDVKTYLDLVEKVCKSQQKCDSNPVVVHCSNGAGRSGTFCAIASCLERVKQEQVLDVFQTVKSIRVNRPGAVETLIQYVFCYQIIQEYLDYFSDYDNFNG